MKDEIKELEEALESKDLTRQEDKRLRSILLKKKGYKSKEIIDILGLKIKTLEKWITEYRKSGIKGLYTKYPDKPNSAKLSQEEKKEIKELLNSKNPKEIRLSNQNYWDIPTLKKLVKEKYGVEYKSRASYTRLFDFCGFSYQRVEFVDTRRDEGEVDAFKKRYSMKSKEGRIVMSW